MASDRCGAARTKIFAVDVLHGEKVLAVYLADVVNPADIRVRNLAGVTHLSMKTGERSGIILKGGGKKLEGYNIPEFKILSAVDLAHAAAAEQSDDPIPLDENRARRKSSALRWVRFSGSWRRPGSRCHLDPRLGCRERKWRARRKDTNGRCQNITPRSQSR